MLGESVDFDAACNQCKRHCGVAWYDPSTRVVDELTSMQEVYDATGCSSRVTGNFTWLYGGPAPR